MLAINLASCSSAFLKSNFYIRKFSVHELLKSSLKNFEHYLTSMWNEHNFTVVWTFFGLAFFGIGMNTDLFQNYEFSWLYLFFSPLPFTSLFSVICKASSDSHWPCCISFSWEWFWLLPPAKCQEPSSILLQAVCLSDLILWNYLSLPLHNHKGFDLGHTWVV